MTISNKLFLITAIALNLGSLLNAYSAYNGYNEYPHQQIFNFTVILSKTENNKAKAVANWLLQEINQDIKTHNNNNNIERITLIINAPLTIEQQIEHLAQIKPSFIQKYAISPVKNSLIVAAATTAAITAFIVAPGVLTFSMEFGMQMAKQVVKELTKAY